MTGRVAAHFRKFVQDLIPAPFRKSTPSPFPDTLHLDRKRDQQENERTTPPDDEKIDLCCIWAVEFYAPSHMEALLTNIRRLGWDEEGIRGFSAIKDWADRSREHPGGGGWQNLGTIRSSGINDLTNKQVHPAAQPPSHVTRMSGRLFSISSSLACVVMMFRLHESFATRLDTALRTERQTYYSEISPHTRSIHDPDTQKSNHIRQIRNELRSTVTKWFSANLPGLFSSGLLEGEMPTCEFVTLRQTEPFPSSDNSARFFLRLLGLDLGIEAWSCVDLPGLKFRAPSWARSVPQYHSILTIKEDDLDDDLLRDAMNWTGREARIVYVDNFAMDGPLWLWALLRMLEGYGKRLGAFRESATLRLDPGLNSVEILKELAQRVSFSVDINVVTSDLQNYAQPKSLHFFEYPSFVPIEAEYYPDGSKLENHLCSMISERAAWIQKMDQSLRDHGTQYGAMLGAMENVRVQEKISCFTRVLVALTIILTIVTIFLMVLTIILGWETLEKSFPISKSFEWLQSVWEMIQVLY